MKNFTLFLAAILLSIASLAQSPGGINYQTVIRDGSGNELANVSLSLKMSIRNGAPNGDVIYVETHDVTSNSWGLVNLVVGNGTVQSGSFSDINWGVGEKYLETAIDTDGSGNYTVLGVTQFLSVPYSLHASNGNYSMTSEERDALVDPPLGMQIFNITTNCLNYFNGYGWYETCGDCTPMPSLSDAGPDQYFSDATTATTLDANTPEYGNGTWSVSSGSGGSFEDVNDPNTLFAGEPCQIYDLKWTITSTCGATEDLVSIEFATPPAVANAGADQTYNDATVSTNLEGNNPEVGSGMWSIEIGNGGTFDDANDPTTLFTGNPCESYTLKWTISNACGNSEDLVDIIFNTPPTTADAGSDQTFNDETTSTNLEANAPLLGTGTWGIEAGNGGTFADVTDPTTLFTGDPCETYTLKWTIINPCGASDDLVGIIFNTPPTTADAGSDQTFNDATISTNLEGNAPLLGIGTWNIQAGNGGTFADVTDPTTLFTGDPCETYTLKWTITNPCGSSEDLVEINFNTPPSAANAGPDQTFNNATISTNLEANTPLLGVGTWSVENGNGGTFDNVNDPTTLFTGAPCESYTLKWMISNPCGTSEDLVDIIFNTPPTTADAGPDQLDIQGTSTSLAGNTPLIGTGQWSILTGTGGNIAEPENPATVFTGSEGVTYDLQWTITNDCGASTDNVLISFAGGGGDWTCGELYTDSRDGQDYETVVIGDQCWIAENLAYLPSVSPSANGSTTDPFYYVYDYSGTDVEEAKLTANFQTYGTLYNYPASQSACPDGWVNPSDDDWKILEGTVDSQYPVGDPVWDVGGWRGFDAGTNLKATSGWDDNGNGVDLYSFSALPGGYSLPGGFSSMGNQGMWWTSTENSSNAQVWGRNLWVGETKSARYDYDKDYGKAVRCLKSDYTPPNQAPEVPTSPNPEDGATNQNIEATTLSWTCTDPESDPLTYDVYFGTDNPPTQVATGQSETTYDPGTLQYNTQYFWKIVAHDDQGNSTEGTVWSFTTEEEPTPFTCGDLFVDGRDDNSYETVQIGDQCWMAENLAYLPAVSPNENGSYTEPYYYVYGYNGTDVAQAKASQNYQNFGVLYNWPASRTACPSDDGWHTATDEEWKILEGNADSQFAVGDQEWNNDQYRGLDAGKNLKSTTGWDNNGNGTDLLGFTALAAGGRGTDGGFYGLGSGGRYWTYTEGSAEHAWYRILFYDNDSSYRANWAKSLGYSVRCIHAEIPQNQPPSPPHYASPYDELNIPVENTILSWLSFDPDGDALTFDVYFGTSTSPAQVASGQSEMSYDPGTLDYSTQYFWRVVAHDDQGNSTSGGLWNFTTVDEPAAFACGDLLVDSRDGQQYATVLIGDQCWMAENLAYLPSVSPSADGSATDPFYYVYDYQGTDVSAAKASNNYQTYGAMYNWPASISVCPEGWHTPTDGEWTILTTYLGGENYAGGKMKETGTSHWAGSNTGATNSSGFTALPGGRRHTNGAFINLVYRGSFWSSTETETPTNAWSRMLYSSYIFVNRENAAKINGLSVRCLRD